MMQEQIVQFTLIGLAVLCVIAGLFMLFGGLSSRTKGQYDVQRVHARSAAYIRMSKGIGMFLLSGLFVVSLLLFRNRMVLMNSPVEPTPFPSAAEGNAPTREPTRLVTLPPTEAPVEIIYNNPTDTPEPEATATESVVEATATPDDTGDLPQTETPPVETVAPTATPIPYDAVVNVVGGLNMRDSPNGNVVELLPNGSGVDLLGESVAAGNYLWLLVVAESGTEGWVAEDFIIFTE